MGNPCILASFQATTNGNSTLNISNTQSKHVGVSTITTTVNEGLVTITLTPTAGYQIKVTSANANVGSTKNFTGKTGKLDVDYNKSAGNFSCHTLIGSNNGNPCIYLTAFAPGGHDNRTSHTYKWDGSTQTSCCVTIFGTVIRTATA